MKVGSNVSYLNCDWIVKEVHQEHIILKSVNKNCLDVTVHKMHKKYLRSGWYDRQSKKNRDRY